MRVRPFEPTDSVLPCYNRFWLWSRYKNVLLAIATRGGERPSPSAPLFLFVFARPASLCSGLSVPFVRCHNGSLPPASLCNEREEENGDIINCERKQP